MKSMIMKGAAAAALVAATAFAATPSEARWSNGSSAAAGFVGGALVGAAVANSANNGYYGSGYGYGYAPGYAYGGPGYYDSYAYEPAPAYYGSRTYYRGNNSTRGYYNDSISNSRAPNE